LHGRRKKCGAFPIHVSARVSHPGCESRELGLLPEVLRTAYGILTII